MAATALQMITAAMRIMRVLGPDQAPSAAEGVDGLYRLNAMTDALGIQRGLIYQVGQATYSWTANAASSTIGAGGSFNATRPIKVAEEGNFMRDGSTSVDYPLTWLGDRDSYDRILLKSSTASYPQWIFVDTGYPLATIYVWPVPTQTLSLYLNTWTPLQTFDTLTEQLAMPAGYQAALEYNLAEWWNGSFGTAGQMSDDDKKRAKLLLQNLRAINRPDLVARLNALPQGRGVTYNIYSDSTNASN